MPKEVLRDADITLDGVNLSDHANNVEITSSKDLQESTGFGAANKSYELGLGDGTMSVTLFQDFDAGSVDATLWPLHSAGTSFVAVIKKSSGAVSATNPSYTMTAVLPEYTPLSGDVGEMSMLEIELQNASQTGIVKAIAPPGP
jgi:hypothetical protein